MIIKNNIILYNTVFYTISHINIKILPNFILFNLILSCFILSTVTNRLSLFALLDLILHNKDIELVYIHHFVEKNYLFLKNECI